MQVAGEDAEGLPSGQTSFHPYLCSLEAAYHVVIMLRAFAKTKEIYAC